MIRYGVLLTAAVLIACGESRPASEETEPVLPTPAWVENLARVANAIERTPRAADSILAANNMTRAAFDSLMYDVAADSALSAAYEALRTR